MFVQLKFEVIIGYPHGFAQYLLCYRRIAESYSQIHFPRLYLKGTGFRSFFAIAIGYGNFCDNGDRGRYRTKVLIVLRTWNSSVWLRALSIADSKMPLTE